MPKSSTFVKPLKARIHRHQPFVRYLADATVWALAIPLAALLRYDFHVERVSWRGVVLSVTLVLFAQSGSGWMLGVYARRWRYASIDEARALVVAVLSVAALLTAVIWRPSHTATVPRSVPFLAASLMLSGSMAVRLAWRFRHMRQSRPDGAESIIVVGAGDAGDQIVRNLLLRGGGPYLPVAILDDDSKKKNLRLHGVRVKGVIDDLAKVARHHGAASVLFAIPSAPDDLVRKVYSLAEQARLRMLILPSVTEMIGMPEATDIRDVNETDLLGRETADIDPQAISHYVAGKRVLVTGAGGSIGSELCRQLARYSPAALIMLDRDESGLHAVQLSIEGRAMLDSPNLALADIRDRGRLDEVFEAHRPHVVFHAAALKHLTLLEQAPSEAWKTNVGGTDQVLQAAIANGVEKFVNISTDKAANPCSVLGYSKRITERMTSHAATDASGIFVSVRFGNVLGSRGSVLTAFRSQAERGGPITVTHADVSRYFMTVEEAVRLTIYAGAIGSSGEVLVLDMGKPVKIVDVAERFALQYDPPLEVVFTGLRAGEKMHEDLIADGEVDWRPVHRLITHVPVPPLSYESAASALELDGTANRDTFREACELESLMAAPVPL